MEIILGAWLIWERDRIKGWQQVRVSVHRQPTLPGRYTCSTKYIDPWFLRAIQNAGLPIRLLSSTKLLHSIFPSILKVFMVGGASNIASPHLLAEGVASIPNPYIDRGVPKIQPLSFFNPIPILLLIIIYQQSCSLRFKQQHAYPKKRIPRHPTTINHIQISGSRPPNQLWPIMGNPTWNM